MTNWQEYEYSPLNWKQETTTLATTQRAYRKNNDRHAIEYPIKCNEEDLRYIHKLFHKLWQHSNKTTHRTKQKLTALQQNKQYKHWKTQYGQAKAALEKTKDPTRCKELTKQKNDAAKHLKQLVHDYRLEKYQISKEARQLAAIMEIPADFSDSRAFDIHKGVEKVLYGNARDIHYLETGKLPPLQGRSYNHTLKIRLDEDGNVILALCHPRSKKNTKPSQKKQKEHYLTLAPSQKDALAIAELERVRSWLANPEGNNARDLLISMLNGNKKMDTGRVCYATLVYKNGKILSQLSIEGSSLKPKIKPLPTPRHARAGADVGTQSIAVSAPSGSFLINIGEEPTSNYNPAARKHEIKLVNRAMDRSRRGTNPDNYKEDGTYKKKADRTPWVKSNHYKQLQEKHRKLCAGDAEARRNANRAIANKCRALARELVTEPSNAKALQKKARKNPDKPNARRKRFGSSVASRAPGQLVAELSNKFGSGFFLTDRFDYRASQYDHTSGEYIKKKLGERWFFLADGSLVQRDLYSAFIEEHAVDEHVPDRMGMVRDFGRFLVEQERIVRECVESGSFPANSGMSARGVNVLGEWFSFDDFFTSRITPRGDGVDSRA